MLTIVFYMALGAVIAHLWQQCQERDHAWREYALKVRAAAEIALLFTGLIACAIIIWAARNAYNTARNAYNTGSNAIAATKYYSANAKLAALDAAAFFMRTNAWAQHLVLHTGVQKTTLFDRYVMRRFQLDIASASDASPSSAPRRQTCGRRSLYQARCPVQ